MFRTFKTPKSNTSIQYPEWPEYDLMFIYQTEYAEMLIAKRFKMALHCSMKEEGKGENQMDSEFLGEAEIDLMTLATGPQDVRLQLKNGEIVIGRVFMNVEMEEISETQVEIKHLKLTENGNKTFNKPPIFFVGKKGGVEMLKVKSSVAKKNNPSDMISFEANHDVTHYMSTSLPDMSENAGLTIEVHERGWIGTEKVGVVEINFYNHLWMINKNRDPENLRGKLKEAEAEVEKAEEELRAETDYEQRTVKEEKVISAKEEFVKASKAAASVTADGSTGWFELLEHNADKTETVALPVIAQTDANKDLVIGTLTGSCHLKYMPRYCQMRAGITVDGVVCNGVSFDYATVDPPFKSKVHKCVVDDNYA